MERYNKFLVEKRSDVEKYLTFDQQLNLQGLLQLIASGRERDGKSDKNYVVVADNWPIYETVWSLIEAFVDNKPNEIESLRQQLAEAEEKVAELEKLCGKISNFAGQTAKELCTMKQRPNKGDDLTKECTKCGNREDINEYTRLLFDMSNEVADLTARLEAQEASEPVSNFDRCKHHVCDEDDDHSPECTDWGAHRRNEAREPHPPTRHCMCDDCKPSFEEASEPVVFTYCGRDKLTGDWEFSDEPSEAWDQIIQLYTTPQPTPTVQAAVAAALRKAAEVCDGHGNMLDQHKQWVKESILALPHSDEALRNFVELGILEGIRIAKSGEEFNLAASALRVLGEVK